MCPPSGWILEVSVAENALTEFFAENVMPSPFAVIASLSDMSALPRLPVIARSLTVRFGSFVEVLVSGPIFTLNAPKDTSIVSLGDLKVSPSLLIEPVISACAKLYMSICDSFMLPLSSVARIPEASMPESSGRKVRSESADAKNFPSMPTRGSSPRISSALPLAFRCRPYVWNPALSTFTFISPSSSVSALTMRSMSAPCLMSLCLISACGTVRVASNEGSCPLPSGPEHVPFRNIAASVLILAASGMKFFTKPSIMSSTRQLSTLNLLSISR